MGNAIFKILEENKNVLIMFNVCKTGFKILQKYLSDIFHTKTLVLKETIDSSSSCQIQNKLLGSFQRYSADIILSTLRTVSFFLQKLPNSAELNE